MATKIVESYLTEQGVKVKTIDETLLKGGWSLSNNATIDIFMEFKDDNHVHLEGLGYAPIPANKKDSMYKLLNDLNLKYKNVKFVLVSSEKDPDDCEIALRDDGVIQLDTAGEEVRELVRMMCAIADDAYPTIMKALWA